MYRPIIFRCQRKIPMPSVEKAIGRAQVSRMVIKRESAVEYIINKLLDKAYHKPDFSRILTFTSRSACP